MGQSGKPAGRWRAGQRGRRAAAAAAAVLAAVSLTMAGEALPAGAAAAAGSHALSRQGTGQQSASQQSASQQSASQQSASQQSASQQSTGRQGSGRTVVSLTFDDGDADQLRAAQILRSHGLRGTFYLITGAVGTPGYLTRTGVRQLAADGMEIGGHTVSHLDLTHVSAAEARRQVCGGRDILARWGLRTTSFAYPGGFVSPALEKIVRYCGFSSARTATGLRSSECHRCALAETLPPAHPYAIRTAGQLDGRWTLAQLQQLVRAVQRHGGGWLPLIFHHICATGRCSALSVRASLLGRFAAWLAGQRAHGVRVQTMGAVTGGRPRPLVTAPAAPAHGVVNPSLEAAGHAASVDPALELPGVPGSFLRCWMPGGFGHSTARWARTRDARAGRWALTVTVTGYRSGDVKLLQQFDTGGCSLPVTAGRSYQLSSWYRATARTQYSVYYRDASGRWAYWRSSPYFPASRGWARAAWQTPPLPAGATGVSFGLSISADGILTTDSYRFSPAGPDFAATLLRWVLVAEGLAAVAAAGYGVARLAQRRRARRAGDGGGQAGRPDPRVSSSSSR